jgi:hypothetical protein
MRGVEIIIVYDWDSLSEQEASKLSDVYQHGKQLSNLQVMELACGECVITTVQHKYGKWELQFQIVKQGAYEEKKKATVMKHTIDMP